MKQILQLTALSFIARACIWAGAFVPVISNVAFITELMSFDPFATNSKKAKVRCFSPAEHKVQRAKAPMVRTSELKSWTNPEARPNETVASQEDIEQYRTYGMIPRPEEDLAPCN